MKIVEPSYEILAMPDGEQALALLERIGRVAYKSEDKIDPGECASIDDGERITHVWKREPSSHQFIRTILKTDRRLLLQEAVADKINSYLLANPSETLLEKTAEDIVAHIMRRLEEDPPHESVIEHCSATVWFTTNRGFTHELVRHRLAAFTQESTRYCDYDKGKFGKELTVLQPPAYTAEGAHVQGLAEWLEAVNDAQRHYQQLRKYGFAPQIARGVVLHDLKADIVCTANFREWLHVFRMRCSPAAHPDMRKLMIPLREEFRRRIPIIFDAR